MLVGLLPAASLIAGATAALWSGLDLRWLAWLLVPSCGIALTAWRRRLEWSLCAALAVGYATAGAALTSDARMGALHTSARAVLEHAVGGFLLEASGPAGDHDPLLSRVVLLEDAAPRDGYTSLRARLCAIRIEGTWRQVEGGIAISVSGGAAAASMDEWRAGRTIEAPIAFRRPVRYLNDGVRDFERDLALDGVTAIGSVKSALLVDLVEHGSPVAELAAAIRAHVRHAVGTWIGPHGDESAAIAAAVLIGDRTGLSDGTRESLQAAGTYHVIAISGGNIAVLAAAVAGLLIPFGVRGRLASIVIVAALVAYALVAAAGPSVWRATLMAALYFLARAIDHRTAAWHTVAVAASVMVVAQPLDVRDPGFVLTFGATVALVEGGRMGLTILPQNRLLAWALGSVVASATVEVVLLPVQAYLFSRITGAGLALNLLAIPLMGVVQLAGLVTAAASSIGSVATWSGWIAHLAATALIETAGVVAYVPWSASRVPPPAVPLICVYYAALGALVLLRSRPSRIVAGAIVLATGLGITTGASASSWSTATQPAVLRLTMFDVGQGEAVLLETPSKERILIDAGGAPFGGGADVGTRVLMPALWARGVRTLDALLVTHGDPDHIGGATDVVTEFTPRAVWMGVPVARHEPTRILLDEARARGIQLVPRRAGEQLQFGDVHVRVLHPPEPDWERRRVRNDDSVVLEIVYAQVGILLTGDISAEVERSLPSQLTPVRTRVLKVAHHGSRTSSSTELLAGWRPNVALVSAGRGNPFGHPAAEVLRRLEAAGATVLRTDRDGQITLETNGRDVEVRTFLGGVWRSGKGTAD